MSLSLSKKKVHASTVLDNSNLPKKISRMKLNKEAPEKRNTTTENTRIIMEQTSYKHHADKAEKPNKMTKQVKDKPKDAEKVRTSKTLLENQEVEVKKSICKEDPIHLDIAVPAYKEKADTTTESINTSLKKRSREKSLANLSSKKLKTLVNHSHPQKEPKHFPTEQQQHNFGERKPLGSTTITTTTFNKNIIILSDDDDDTYGAYGEPALHTLQLSKKTNRNKLSLSKKRHS